MQVVLFTRNKKVWGFKRDPMVQVPFVAGAWVPKFETPTLIYLAKTNLPNGKITLHSIWELWNQAP